MKVVRRNVFETNSSSSHSVSIGSTTRKDYTYDYPHNNKGQIPIKFGSSYDFGWGYAEYSDNYSKLNYIMTAIFNMYQSKNYRNETKIIKDMNNFFKIEDVKRITDLFKRHIPWFKGFYIRNVDDVIGIMDKKDYSMYDYSEVQDKKKDGFCVELRDCGIDHQMWEDCGSLREFISQYHVSLSNFLFNPNVKLIIDNDNEPFNPDMMGW